MVSRKVYWRNLTPDGSGVASTQVCTLSVTPAKFSASVCPDLHATSIFPWRQVSRTSRFAGAASKRVVPANQAVSLRFSNENNDAVVGLNLEGHRIPHDVTAGGKFARRNLRRRETGTDLKKRRPSKPKDALRGGGALSQCDYEAVGISGLAC